MIKKKIKLIDIAIYIVLACTYIIPTGFIQTSFDFSKLVFSSLFCVLILLRGKIKTSEILMAMAIVLLTVITKNLSFLTFLPLLYIGEIVENKDAIKRKILGSNVLYVCLAFTIFYSVLSIFLVSVPEGSLMRFARTGIVEPNQSAFAIFILGVLLLKKNKKIGIATLFFGFLTFSRLYMLSVVLFAFSKTNFAKKIIGKIDEKKWTYLRLTFIFLVLLVLLGFWYLALYQNGYILPDSQLTNRFSLLDYSNLHRFTVNIMFIYMLIVSPKEYLLFGIDNDKFVDNMRHLANNEFGVHYSGNVPHNLFLSHLKTYGLFAFFELYYTSKYLKMIITKHNFVIFIIIFLTSSLLGCGLYSYWLYLSMFALTTYMDSSSLVTKRILHK